MHKHERQIRMWLDNSSYQNPPQTLREIINVLNEYKGLMAKCEPYVFNDGTRLDLLNLGGTIPVSYKGATYNIPVCIWLMNTHPLNAPICYVKPTPDMQIKVSMFVDYNGKIYLPYLHDWVPNSSDISGLIQVMIVTFGETPPVFAKKQKPDSSHSTTTPYPSATNMPQPGAANPFPYMPYTASGASPYPPPTTSYPPYPTQPNPNFQPYPSYGQVVMPTPGPAGGTITEEHIRLSLLSAVEDKLKRRLREQFSQNQAELDTLRRIQQELQQGKQKLEGILNKLDMEQTELDKNIQILQDKEKELNNAIDKISNEEFNVEDAVTTTAPLYKQLLNAFAEEAATEDAIYYMDEALRRNVIDLDVFLKQVRMLSNKQFMLRALMQKCRQKAGLVG